MASQEENNTMVTNANYPNRVVIKTILGRDGGLGFVGSRLVIGGWVKSSREVRKEAVKPAACDDNGTGVALSSKKKDKVVRRLEMLKSRIPGLKVIIQVLCGGASPRQKLEPVLPKPPLPSSLVILQVSDGSCVATLQVVVDPALASSNRLLAGGTFVLTEGVLQRSSVEGEHVVELKANNILHIRMGDQDKYFLSRKQLPVDSSSAFAPLGPRTTAVASIMQIRNALAFATHTFFENYGFLNVQVPVITATDAEGFSEKFQVTSLFDKAYMEEPDTAIEIHGLNLEAVKSVIKEKSNQVEQLKRSESNKETLFTALEDLRRTNELAEQLETEGKMKPVASIMIDQIDTSEDFFSNQTYLTVSGHLHLESYACALGNVYSFGPRFQAKKKESPKSMAEMWMVEAEMPFSQLEDAMNCADDYFKFLCAWIVENCARDMELVSSQIDKTIVDRMQSMTSCSLEKITYTEAVKVLEKVAEKVFGIKLEWGVALTSEHLSYLADEIYKRPLIIYDFPKAVKPFYVRLNDDGNTVAAFDMVVPKIGTLITGSENEERINELNTRIEELGLSREQYEWYLDLRRHGTVKHSGFSLGFDLMVLFATGLTEVKDVIPFPRRLGKANN